MSKEAMKLALEALENAEYGDHDKKELNKAITALREALAEQPAQRTWVGLTDEERDAMIDATDLSGTYYYDDLYAVILLAEGKLKEKNT